MSRVIQDRIKAVQAIKSETHRFLKTVDALLDKYDQPTYRELNFDGNYTKENSALKRASMDLSRMLALYRQGKE